MSLICTFEHR